MVQNISLRFNECFTKYLDRFIDIDPKSDNICVFLPECSWHLEHQAALAVDVESAEQTRNNLFWHQASFLLSS